MNLKDICPGFLGEDRTTECKRVLDRQNTLGWLKTVAGFMNSTGGTIYLGVDDRDFSLIGFTDKELDSEKAFFYQQCRLHLQTFPDVDSRILSYSIREKERKILVLDVHEAERKPVILVYDGIPSIYVRRDAFTSPATVEEIETMVLSSKRARYDVQTSDVPYRESDFTKLFEVARERRGSLPTPKELASIPFYDERGMLYRGSLLFSDSCDEPCTSIVATSYAGVDKGVSLVLDTASYRGNLLGGLEFMLDFVKRHSRHGYVKLPTSRKDIDSFPERAVFEAAVNALAHRDYFIDGSEISLSIFTNRLEIVSPGSYKRGELPPTYSFSEFASERRNELVSNVFVYLKAMEKRGSGFMRISEEYGDCPSGNGPYILSKGGYFKIVLPDLLADEASLPETDSLQLGKPLPNGSAHARAILAFCYPESRGPGEISAHLGLSDSTYFRKKILSPLVEAGFLLETRTGRKKSYLSNREVVSLL